MSWPEVVAVSVFLVFCLCLVAVPLVIYYLLERHDQRQRHDR